MSQPQIIIDPNEELRIVCKLLYYNIPGFCPNAKELQKNVKMKGSEVFNYGTLQSG